MKRAKQYVLLLLIVLTCIFMPLSCVPILFIANSVNPMQVAFITEFMVENQSGQDISITPIGTWGRKGNRSRLPVYKTRFPAFMASKTGDYHLSPGESKKVLYDWDEINFSEITVRTDDGRFYQLVVDPNPTERQYHSPETNRFAIPQIAELETIDAGVLEAARKQSGIWRFRFVMTCALALPVVLWRLIVAYKRERRNAQQSTQPYSCSASAPPPPVS